MLVCFSPVFFSYLRCSLLSQGKQWVVAGFQPIWHVALLSSTYIYWLATGRRRKKSKKGQKDAEEENNGLSNGEGKYHVLLDRLLNECLQLGSYPETWPSWNLWEVDRICCAHVAWRGIFTLIWHRASFLISVLLEVNSVVRVCRDADSAARQTRRPTEFMSVMYKLICFLCSGPLRRYTYIRKAQI